MKSNKKYIVLEPNGDPYGTGFEGIEMDHPDDRDGIYRGDLSPMSREQWRSYCHRKGFILREWRN